MTSSRVMFILNDFRKVCFSWRVVCVCRFLTEQFTGELYHYRSDASTSVFFYLFLLLLSSECEVSQTVRTRFSSVCGLMSLAVVGGTRHVSEDVVCSCVASDR